MYITRLECRCFRRLAEMSFEPLPGLNVIRGGNAQGKTTLLEAVLYAATSKSHRTSNESELPHYGKDGFQVRAWAQRSDRDVQIEANWYRGAKRFKVNGAPQSRISDILGRINVVFFSPEDVELVKGGASGRRRFLDMEISQINPAYLGALQQYRQVLRQRNELLRANAPDPDLLDVWDTQLASFGAQVAAGRDEYVGELSGFARDAYRCIAGSEAMDLSYQPDIRTGEDYSAVLTRARVSDLKQRLTQRGPHRDDIEILIDGRPARSHASQGQQKTAALSMKLAELELVRSHIGEYPVLLLDEVLAELDAARARRLFEAIGDDVQCIMTTTGAVSSAEAFGSNASFKIEQGHLEKE